MRPLVRKTLDWIPQAPVRVTRSRRIPASSDRVWEAIADHERWPEWFGALTAVERIGTGEGVGSGRRVHLKGISVEEEFLVWEPGRRFAFTVVRATRPGIKAMVEDVRLEPDGDTATTVSYTQAIQPVGARVVAPLVRRAVPRTLDGALEGLERHVTG
jgi:uncharacterized protein YndB with AHSA1/START domain